MISDPSTTSPTCSLTELAEKFERWRATRTCRGSTPAELRCQAVALLDQHSRAQITQSLGVNSTAFGQWVRLERGEAAVAPARKRKTRSPNTVSSDFVELPQTTFNDPLPLLPESTTGSVPRIHTPISDLVVDLPDGTRIVARGAPCTEQLLRHWSQSRLPGAMT